MSIIYEESPYCFADDRDDFWKNFKIRQEDNFVGIYYKKGKCILPDMDSCNYTLYMYHQFLWNRQCMIFKRRNIKNIPFVTMSEGNLGLNIDKKDINLGSDSVISIYWHYKDMQDVIEKIKIETDNEQYQDALKEIEKIDVSLKEKRQFDEEYFKSDWKKFIWLYLQKSNTIGGFIVFPRNPASINTERGNRYGKIRDRFDLTLECIRRYYEDSEKSEKDNYYNPLFHVLQKDAKFFTMFGMGREGFQNYIDFFYLQKWVKQGQVLDLCQNEETLEKWNFSDNPLPTKENWWTFYRNIMDRLKERNDLIKMSI